MLILNLIIQLLIALLTFLVPIGIIVGIVFAFLRRSPDHAAHKSLYTKIMIWSFAGPIGGLFLILTIWGLVFVLNQSF